MRKKKGVSFCENSHMTKIKQTNKNKQTKKQTNKQTMNQTNKKHLFLVKARSK